MIKGKGKHEFDKENGRHQKDWSCGMPAGSAIQEAEERGWLEPRKQSDIPSLMRQLTLQNGISRE
jgi:hypothetical protein